ncbi:Inner membrane protein yiaA [Escherichia coli]|nr:Inner membrane protein yiaA [Escherichia coli]
MDNKISTYSPAFSIVSWIALVGGIVTYLLGLWNAEMQLNEKGYYFAVLVLGLFSAASGFAPIFPDICYHLTHYKPAAADIPVASDNPAHYADAIRYNARTPLQGSLLPLTRLVWA